MNSRERRKAAAAKHNERIALIEQLHGLQAAIREKHGVWVRAFVRESNASVVAEIERLAEMLGQETLPAAEPSKGLPRSILAMSAFGIMCTSVLGIGVAR